MSRPKLLILYTELASYTIACLHALDLSQLEVHLVRWPVNKEAPFQFEISPQVHVYERNDYDDKKLLQLAEKIKPDAILCSGWIDKGYLNVCRAFSSSAVNILTMDNKWQGTARQYAACLFARFSLKPVFKYIWVPGEQQKIYARKLGFRPGQIRTGFYSADLPQFDSQYLANRAAKQNHFPHRILYVGRYYDFKGVNELWAAFERVKAETASDWELWCVGTGDLVPARFEGIRHFGFVQPADLHTFIRDCGVFVLPSIVEPWGVVVHEFAAAGFPLLLSKNVGAAGAFLQEGQNGFSFDAADTEQLAGCIRKMINLGDKELFAMGECSHELGLKISPRTWAETLHSLIPSR